jgi:tight adherence protein C
MILLIIVLLFGAVTVLVTSLVAESRRVRVSERISVIKEAAPRRLSPIEEELQRSFYVRIIAPALQNAANVVMRLAPGQALAQTRMKLERAGSPSHLTVPTFIVIRAISMIVGLVAGVWLFSFLHGEIQMRMLASSVTILAGLLLPDYMLSSAAQKRSLIIRKSLPDIIDLLVVSTEAGTGLDGALAEVVRRKSGPMPQEFARVLTEVRLGKRRRDAWDDMAERVNVSEMKMLVAALHQAEQLGVSIANTLRAQSDSLRTKKSLRVRTVAATLSVKMLFPLIFFIFPTLFIIVIGPGVLSMQAGMRLAGQ